MRKTTIKIKNEKEKEKEKKVVPCVCLSVSVVWKGMSINQYPPSPLLPSTKQLPPPQLHQLLPGPSC